MGPSREAFAGPGYGVGLVWWPDLDPLCRPCEGLVHVIEAEPEAYWIPRIGRPSGFTSRLPAALGHLPQPKLLHGVGAPFGGSVGQSVVHREALSGDIAAVQPAWISDHLSFNQFAPSSASSSDQTVCAGFFLPPAQCPEGIRQATEHIRRRREAAGVPVAFENPVSYLPPRPDEMPDGVFAAEVAERANCGIVLDLHNLLCNERNGRQTVQEFCNSIPVDRVWELHLAGGQFERGFWLDAHSGLVEPALMDILFEIVPRLPALGAIIFEIMPEFVASTGLMAIGALLGHLNDVWATRGRSAEPQKRHPRSVRISRPLDPVTPAMWENALGATVTGFCEPNLVPELTNWIRSAERPLELYRYLAQEGRASSLVFTAPRTLRLLLTHLGEAETRLVLAHFWRCAAPAYTSTEEALAFLDFLSCLHLAIPQLDASIATDRDSLGEICLV